MNESNFSSKLFDNGYFWLVTVPKKLKMVNFYLRHVFVSTGLLISK